MRELYACGLDGNNSGLSQDVQQGQQQSASAYHLGNSIWNYIYSHKRTRQGRVSVAGFGKSSSFPEILCELGGAVEFAEHELKRWEDDGGVGFERIE